MTSRPGSVSDEAAIRLSDADRRAAGDIAFSAIRDTLLSGMARPPRVEDVSPELRRIGCCFVTLTRGGELLGCMGTLGASRALGVEIAAQAVHAAFGDPRFSGITRADLPDLTIEISVLGPLVPLAAAGYSDLLEQLRPDTGYLVNADHRQGTLLPTVWRSIPHREDFLRALWRKCGLRVGDWPEGTRVWSYSAELIERQPEP